MVVRRALSGGRLRRAGAAAAMALVSCCVPLLLGLMFSPGVAASSRPVPPRPTWVWPTPPAPPTPPPPPTPSHPPTPTPPSPTLPSPTPPSPSIPDSPGAPSVSPSLSPRPSPSSPYRPPVNGIDRPAGYAQNPAASGARMAKPDREPPARAAANSHPNRDQLPASSLYASRSVAQSLIIGGLAGFTVAAIAMVLLGWVRRRL